MRVAIVLTLLPDALALQCTDPRALNWGQAESCEYRPVCTSSEIHCSSHGTCAADGFSCNCMKGWGGEACENLVPLFAGPVDAVAVLNGPVDTIAVQQAVALQSGVSVEDVTIDSVQQNVSVVVSMPGTASGYTPEARSSLQSSAAQVLGVAESSISVSPSGANFAQNGRRALQIVTATTDMVIEVVSDHDLDTSKIFTNQTFAAQFGKLAQEDCTACPASFASASQVTMGVPKVISAIKFRVGPTFITEGKAQQIMLVY